MSALRVQQLQKFAGARQKAMQRLQQSRARRTMAGTTAAIPAPETWQQAFMPDSAMELGMNLAPELLMTGVVMATLPEDLAQEQGRLLPGLEEMGWGLGGSAAGRGLGAFIGSRFGHARMGANLGDFVGSMAANFMPRHYINEYQRARENEAMLMQSAGSFTTDNQIAMLQQLYGGAM